MCKTRKLYRLAVEWIIHNLEPNVNIDTEAWLGRRMICEKHSRPDDLRLNQANLFAASILHVFVSLSKGVNPSANCRDSMR